MLQTSGGAMGHSFEDFELCGFSDDVAELPVQGATLVLG